MSPKYEKTQRFRWVIVVGERGFPTFFQPLLTKRKKQPFPRFRSKRVAQSVAQFVAQSTVNLLAAGQAYPANSDWRSAAQNDSLEQIQLRAILRE
ncbi:MAG: hypothetical protein VYA25_07110 [Pseudomonadota bacterium]|nr:hypothetical protein [Pseudomonadota bacterium]|tara:strand:- start:655 stop:939 length:285 start_codon:yes stop_codon:yes gene_type:complete